MKLFLTNIFMLFQFISIAQVDTNKGINFQAIARNADGSIVPSKDISIRLSIREGSASGTIEYQEIKTTSTNVVGLFSVVLGSNSNSNITVIGDYNNINWQTGNKYLQVEIDPFNSINFIFLGVQKINYVPYALVANSIDWANVKGLNTELNKKLNIQDTTTMLKPYLKSGSSIVATQLETARKINGVDFDGSADIIIPASSSTNTLIAAKESIDNKSINIITDASSDVKYPSVKAVKTYVDGVTVAGAPDADLTTKGLIKLSGDLSGTANAPIVSKINGTSLSGLTTGLLKNTTSTGVPSIAIAGTDYQSPLTAGSGISINGGTISATGLTTSNLANNAAIANNQLANKTITIGSTGIDLGNTSTSLAGLTSVTSNGFTGNLNGNASTATTAGNITATSNTTLTSLANLNTVGTITTGNWSATAIDIAHGGTGASTLSGILLGTNGSGLNSVSTAAYGSWYDSQSQSASANTATPMLFRTQDFADGISIVDNSKITFSKAGKYNIQFSAQLDRIAGTTTDYISIWLNKNGQVIPATCTDVTIQGGTAVAASVAAWNFFQSVNANDNIEIMWSTPNVQLYIQATPARTAPIRPAIPSIILTVQQVY